MLDIGVSSFLILLFSAVFSVSFFRKLGLSPILGYLFAGVLLGPFVFKVILKPDDILHFAEFGVVMLLFVIGLELKPEKLIQMRNQIFGAGLSQLSLCFLGFFLFLYSFMQFDLNITIILAITLSLSSTALASQLLEENGILASALGRLGFAILLFQDLAVIFLLLLVNLHSKTDQTQVPLWIALLTVCLLIFPGRFLLNKTLYWVAKYGSREIMTAFALLIIFSVAFLMQAVGLSTGLGAFLAGIFLANSQYRHQLETDIEPFKGMLLGLFFMAVGMSMNLELLFERPIYLLSLTLLLMVFKSSVICFIVRYYKYSWKKSVRMAIALSQGGEFGFVVMSQLLSFEIISRSFTEKVNLIIALSMLCTPIFYMINVKIGKILSSNQKEDKTEDDTSFGESEVIIAGFGRFSQMAGRIFLANNIPFIAIDKNIKHVNYVNKFGNNIVYGDATRLDILQQAGIQKAKILIIGIDDALKTLKLASMILENYPNVKVIARAKDRQYAYKLHALGNLVVVRELFEGGLEAALNGLIHLGYSDGQALEKIDTYRKYDQQVILESVQYKDDEDKLIELAKKRKKELEELYK